MNSLKRIIQESIIIAENIQQADKIYFKTGLLSPNVRRHIVHITEGDAWTKLLTDIYYAEMMSWKKNGHWAVGALDKNYKDPESESEYHTPGVDDMMNLEDWKRMRQFHNQLKAYNKNVFPIAGLNANGVKDIWELIRSLKERASILEMLKQMPSIAIRNMKADIREVRSSSDLQSYRHSLEHFLSYYSLLGNRDPKLRKTIENKMFTAGVTLDDLLRFVEEKENLLGGAKFTRNSIKKIVKENSQNELEIIYDKGNYMVVEVVGPHGIKEIGCNSLWCFTYGSGFDGAWRQWNNYSTNGIVYAIIDFSVPSDSPDFMHVLIKPLDYNADSSSDDGDENDSKLFNMANEESYNSLGFIEGSIGTDTAKKLLTFGEEPEEENEDIEDTDEEKPEPEYQDPNQLKLDLQELRRIVRAQFLNEHLIRKINSKISNDKLGKFSSVDWEDVHKNLIINSDLKKDTTFDDMVFINLMNGNRPSKRELEIFAQIWNNIPDIYNEKYKNFNVFLDAAEKAWAKDSGEYISESVQLAEAKKSKFQKLEDNKVPLTDEERKTVMDADAIWHHGPGGKPSPAVWKSKDKNGKITYVTNTHRAYQDRPTLKGAISIYHSFIKGTA